MKPKFIKDNSEKIKVSHEEDTDIHVTKTFKEKLNALLTKVRLHINDNSIHPTKEKQNEWDSKETVSGSKAKCDKVESHLKIHSENRDLHVSKVEKQIFNDKYTKNEIDNMLSVPEQFSGEEFNTEAEFNVVRFNSNDTHAVGTIAHIRATNQYFRKYKNNKWYSDNLQVPMATSNVDGKMSSSDYTKLSKIEENANNYTHPDDEYTRHVTDEQIYQWDHKANDNLVDFTHKGLMPPEAYAKLMKLQINDDETVTLNSSSNNISTPIDKFGKIITIGPRFSGADFICTEEDDLGSIVNSIFNNIDCSAICIVGSSYAYNVKTTIKIDNSGFVLYGINARINCDMKLSTVIEVLKDSVSISGFEFICLNKDNRSSTFISILGNLERVYDCTFKNANAIILHNSDNTIISNCKFLSGLKAIDLLYSGYNIITSNIITGVNTAISFTTNCCVNNVVNANIITKCTTGILRSSQVIDVDNSITNNIIICTENLKVL